MTSPKKHLPFPDGIGGSGISENGNAYMGLEVDAATLERNRGVARQLLRELAPLFPVVAASTRNLAGANLWVDVWARHISLAGLNGQDIARAVRRLGELDPSRPFAWPAFLSLAELSRSGLC